MLGTANNFTRLKTGVGDNKVRHDIAWVCPGGLEALALNMLSYSPNRDNVLIIASLGISCILLRSGVFDRHF